MVFAALGVIAVTLILCIFPGVFFIIAFIFSVIPDTRIANIKIYNKIALEWIEFNPILTGTNITIQSDISSEIFFYKDYSTIDKVPNTRVGDEFLDYEQLRFLAPGFDYYQNEKFQIGRRKSFTVKMSHKDIGEAINTRSFDIFSTSQYCCQSSKNGCHQTCYHHYRLSEFCLVLDLKFQKVLSQGCFGGFGSLGYRETNKIETGLFSTTSLKFDVMAREIRDPWYQIPYIIGFGGLNSWGVTRTDRIIVLSVFYALCLITCCLYGILGLIGTIIGLFVPI
eukprot:gene11820-5151_t